MSGPRPRSFRLEFSDEELAVLQKLAATEDLSAASYLRTLISRAAGKAKLSWPEVEGSRSYKARAPKKAAKGGAKKKTAKKKKK